MRPTHASLLSALLVAGSAVLHAQAPPPVAGGIGDLLVAPTRLVFEGRKRSAELNLSNIGRARATYRITLVRMDMDEGGAFQEKALDPGAEGMQALFRFSPREVTLDPQESQTVRIQVRKPAELEAGEYRLHMVFRAVPTPAPVPPPLPAATPAGPKGETPKPPPARVEEPKRQVPKGEVAKASNHAAEAARQAQGPKAETATRPEARREEAPRAEVPAPVPSPAKEEGPKGLSIRLTPVYGVAIPLIVRHGDTAAKVAITGARLGEGAKTLRFRLERNGNQSVYGDLQATYLPPSGAPVVLFDVAGLAVYTPNPGRTVIMALPAVTALASGGRIRITYSVSPQDGGALLAESFLSIP